MHGQRSECRPRRAHRRRRSSHAHMGTPSPATESGRLRRIYATDKTLPKRAAGADARPDPVHQTKHPARCVEPCSRGIDPLPAPPCTHATFVDVITSSHAQKTGATRPGVEPSDPMRSSSPRPPSPRAAHRARARRIAYLPQCGWRRLPPSDGASTPRRALQGLLALIHLGSFSCTLPAPPA